MTIRELHRPVGPFRVEEVEQGGCPTMIRIFTNVTALLSYCQVPGQVELDHTVIRLEAFISILDVSQHLSVSRQLQLLRLSNRQPGTLDLSLVSIEEGRGTLTRRVPVLMELT